MDNLKKYNLCTLCDEINDLRKFHQNLRHLSYLLQEPCVQSSRDMLFRKSSEVLLEIDGSFTHISKAKFNKIVLKYYIYIIKHRHLTPSPCYSPLKKEDLLVEYQQHLDIVRQVF